MILLTAVAIGLYVLGGVLAWELSFELSAPHKRIAMTVFWPSVAVFLLFDR
jgi:hypothetical protein